MGEGVGEQAASLLLQVAGRHGALRASQQSSRNTGHGRETFVRANTKAAASRSS